MKGCIAIGDIHGCLDELRQLVGMLEEHAFLSDQTRLVFVGDYVDRGPDSAGVIEYLIGLRDKWPCVFLLGNHDDTFLRRLYRCDGFRPANGEFETVLSYTNGSLERTDIVEFLAAVEEGVPMEDAVARTGEALGKPARLDIPRLHLDFLLNLEPYWREDRVVFCHGGVKDEWDSFDAALQPENRWELITARGDAEHFLKVPGMVQVVGHRRLEDVTIRGWICMIDTGCTTGRALSALVIPNGWSTVLDFDIVQVPARRNWREVYWDAIRSILPESYVPKMQRRQGDRRNAR